MRRFVILLTLLALTAGTSAQTYVELVLDASGSMWNTLDDGRYRITGAKDALSAFVRGLPDGDLDVGLRVYGSRVEALDEGACQDSALVVPLQGVDKAALQSTVDAVTARGATPIATSLNLAAADFPAAAQRRVIVLVTDGQESCGGDLAAAVAALEAAGIELRIIGFTLPDKAAQAFAQLGTFENAADAEALARALLGVVDDVAPATADTKQASVVLEAPDEVAAGTPYTVRWTGETGDNDALRLTAPDAPDDAVGQLLTYVAEDPFHDDVAPLTEGAYELRYLSAGAVVARRPLTVTPSPATLRVVDEAVFPGTWFSVAWTGPGGPQDYVTVVPPDTADGNYGEYAMTRNGPVLTLLAPSDPGPYELRYQSDADPGVVLARAAVLVLAPKPITLEGPAEVGSGTDFEVVWTGPDAEQDYITIAPVGSPEGTYLSYAYTAAGNPAQLRAPLQGGAYELRYSTDRSDAQGRVFAAVPISVTATEVTLTPPASVTAGTTITVDVQGPANHSDYITLVPSDAEDGQYGNYAYVTQAGPVELQVPEEPGAYEIRYQNDADPSVILGRVAVTVSAP